MTTFIHRANLILKLLESAAAAIPIITNGGTYSDIKAYQGIRVNGAKEWRKAIELLNKK
jgi:hypothetical protein